MLGVVAISVILGVVAFIVGGNDIKTYAEVDGVKCQSGERLDYHIHPELTIFVNNEQAAVPPNVGIRPDECLFWLHTHSDVPRIHVEAPEKHDFTLGQFFAVWGQPLSETQLLDQTADDSHAITATVDGEPVTGNPADIILRDGEMIVLEYGER